MAGRRNRADPRAVSALALKKCGHRRKCEACRKRTLGLLSWELGAHVERLAGIHILAKFSHTKGPVQSRTSASLLIHSVSPVSTPFVHSTVCLQPSSAPRRPGVEAGMALWPGVDIPRSRADGVPCWAAHTGGTRLRSRGPGRPDSPGTLQAATLRVFSSPRPGGVVGPPAALCFDRGEAGKEIKCSSRRKTEAKGKERSSKSDVCSPGGSLLFTLQEVDFRYFLILLAPLQGQTEPFGPARLFSGKKKKTT